MDIEYMKSKIMTFIDQYWGTAIGESIYNWMCNTRDDDYEGIEAIYKDLEAQGYVE